MSERTIQCSDGSRWSVPTGWSATAFRCLLERQRVQPRTCPQKHWEQGFGRCVCEGRVHSAPTDHVDPLILLDDQEPEEPEVLTMQIDMTGHTVTTASSTAMCG